MIPLFRLRFGHSCTILIKHLNIPKKISSWKLCEDFKPWTERRSLNTFNNCRALKFKHRDFVYKSSLDFNRKMSFKSNIVPQNYDFFLVLDFEATCDKPRTPKPQEIIEFPVLKLNSKTFKVESTFHTYVQPKINKELSTFCIELTGIIQDQIDDQPHLEDILQNFDQWLRNENLLKPDVKFIFVTCGDWDLYTMLPGQCNYFNIPLPDYFKKWVNIKKSYASVTRTWPKGLIFMCKGLGLTPIGKLHSGIDDCRNIVSIMRTLAEREHVFTPSGGL